MSMDEATRRALDAGREQADEVLEFRAKALRKRAAVFARQPLSLVADEVAAAAATPMPPVLAAAAASMGSLVAEGDSWFDYPWTDVLRMLEDEHGYDVDSVAHKGDRVEEMAYGGGQLEEFTRRIEKLLRKGRPPKAILLSGGGNDIAGSEFAMLLNHAASAMPGLNEQVVAGVVDERIRLAYVYILSAVTRICEKWLQQPLPILVHGYDYPVPDGRGFMGGWGFLPGPWLEPGFREKGFTRLEDRKALMKRLIDRFNTMLAQVAALQEFPHVRYVDLRNTLSSGADYKKFWDNELHPTPRGFGLVADRFVAALTKLT
ncbi:MAG: hypothetical protein JO040_04225 [Gemmatimonadetes bacterium]|nr:hypothetical protein [Gemmatimonadota bacterium]